MGKAYALLRAGFPYVKTLGMRRMTSNPIDLALGRDSRTFGALLLGAGRLGKKLSNASPSLFD